MEKKKLEDIIKMAYDEDYKVRKEAAFLLRDYYYDPNAVNTLFELSRDKEKEVIDEAKKSLEYMKNILQSTEQVEQLLSKLMQKSSNDQSNQKQEIREIEIEDEIQVKKESQTLDNITQILYNSLSIYKEDENLLKKKYESVKQYIMNELELVYELIRYQNKNEFDISRLKDKLKNVTTGILTVKDISNRDYVDKKTKKKYSFYRLIVKDFYGREGVVYIPAHRFNKIEVNSQIILQNVEVRALKNFGETALFVNDNSIIKVIV